MAGPETAHAFPSSSPQDAVPRAGPLGASVPPCEPEGPAPPAPRGDPFTPERRARFLAALAELGSARAACARAGVSAQTVYLLRRRDAVFAAAWDGALVLARGVAEDVLAVRALDGTEEPVFYRGEQVGTRVRFDARLLLAHLARLDAHAAASRHGARRAERFDELLALVAGERPPAAMTEGLRTGEPGRGGADPVLPPDCAAHVERTAARLPRRISEAAYRASLAAAEDAWQGWARTARGLADRLLAEVDGGSDGAADGGVDRGRGATPIRTVSTVSTAALGRALAASGAGGLPPAPG